MDIKIMACLLSMGFNYLILYGRRTDIVRNKYTVFILFALSIIGVLAIALNGLEEMSVVLAYWGLCCPAAFLLIDYAFARIAFSLHGRDYYLWLKGSPDLLFKDFKASDKIFSILMIYITMALPFFPVIISQLWKAL